MTAIEFTAIPDTDADYETSARIDVSFPEADRYRGQTHAHGMERCLASVDQHRHAGTGSRYFARGLHLGQQPHVSMNALRPIPSHLITKIGSESSPLSIPPGQSVEA